MINKKEAAAKRKDKAFDESGARSTLETDFQEMGHKLVARTQKVHEDIQFLNGEIEKDEWKTDAATKLKSAINLMQGRHAMLVVAMGDDSKSVEHNVEVWQAYCTSKLITDLLNTKNEPYHKMASVKCMTATVLSLGVFTLTTHDDIKVEKSRMKDVTQVWDQMLNHVKEQKNRVRGAYTKLVKAKEFEDAKAADMAKKAAETAEGKVAKTDAIKKAAARKSAIEHKKAATWKIFESFSFIEDCKIVQKLEAVSQGCAEPWICKHAKSVFVASEKVGAAFSVFMDKFKASDAYKQSGRGADTFSSELYVREVWNAPDKMFFPTRRKLLDTFQVQKRTL